MGKKGVRREDGPRWQDFDRSNSYPLPLIFRSCAPTIFREPRNTPPVPYGYQAYKYPEASTIFVIKISFDVNKKNKKIPSIVLQLSWFGASKHAMRPWGLMC
jgi:adenine specific DNA methylase Mod